MIRRRRSGRRTAASRGARARRFPGPPENISAPTMDDAWLFVHRSGVDSHGTLFATSDGGSTWRRVVLPPMRRTGPGDRPTAT